MTIKTLPELKAGDVIIDPQGKRHIIIYIEDDYVDPDDGDKGWRVFTDEEPQGRGIFPLGEPSTIKFLVAA